MDEMHCHYEEMHMEKNSTYLHYGKNNTVRRVHIDHDLMDPTTGLTRLRAEDVTIKMLHSDSLEWRQHYARFFAHRDL